MFTIQANPSGTRSLNISEENLKTIEKYSLFQQLIDSNGIVDESVLEKLKLNIRSLIGSSENGSSCCTSTGREKKVISKKQKNKS